jgi:hypothetical protein
VSTVSRIPWVRALGMPSRREQVVAGSKVKDQVSRLADKVYIFEIA